MNAAHIRNIDLNLLVIASALYRHKNVSEAARSLGLTQSAVSHALTRLRDQFKDPLFVRTAKGVAPTRYAREIEDSIQEIIQKVELLASNQSKFDPLEAQGRITIAGTDYFEILVMPKLMAILAKEAPGLQVSLRPTKGDLPKQELQDGVFDLAVAGFYRDLPEGFYQTKLYSDEFQCAAGKKHPLFLSKNLSRDDFFSARHALITLQGDFRDGTKDSRAGAERTIAYGSYSFTGMAWVLESSDLLLTAPSRLLREYQKFFHLKAWPSPVEKKGIDVRMIWHAQTHKDPLRIWFREKLKSVCREI